MRRLIRFLLLLWLLVTAATRAKSQEKPIQLISGQVVGNDSLPAIGVAVIMQHIDSTYIGATITDADGHFTLNHPNKRYRLLFQHVSYIPYTLETAEKRLGIIQLNEDTKTLGEVTITAQRPLVKMADDKLIYNPKTYFREQNYKQCLRFNTRTSRHTKKFRRIDYKRGDRKDPYRHQRKTFKHDRGTTTRLLEIIICRTGGKSRDCL